MNSNFSTNTKLTNSNIKQQVLAAFKKLFPDLLLENDL